MKLFIKNVIVAVVVVEAEKYGYFMKSSLLTVILQSEIVGKSFHTLPKKWLEMHVFCSSCSRRRQNDLFIHPSSYC